MDGQKTLIYDQFKELLQSIEKDPFANTNFVEEIDKARLHFNIWK